MAQNFVRQFIRRFVVFVFKHASQTDEERALLAGQAQPWGKQGVFKHAQAMREIEFGRVLVEKFGREDDEPTFDGVIDLKLLNLSFGDEQKRFCVVRVIVKINRVIARAVREQKNVIEMHASRRHQHSIQPAPKQCFQRNDFDAQRGRARIGKMNIRD